MTDPNIPQEGAQPPAAGGPYGAPYGTPPGGDSYGTPPTGDPYAPPSPGPYGAPPPAGQFPGAAGYQVAPPKKRRTGRTIGIIVGAFVLLAVVCSVGAVLVLRGSTSGTKANEGDCLAGDAITGAQSTTKPLKVVKCDASDARYKVIAKIPNKKESEAQNSLCLPYADKGAQIIYWSESSVGSGVGSVLCLGQAKP